MSTFKTIYLVDPSVQIRARYKLHDNTTVKQLREDYFKAFPCDDEAEATDIISLKDKAIILDLDDLDEGDELLFQPPDLIHEKKRARSPSPRHSVSPSPPRSVTRRRSRFLSPSLSRSYSPSPEKKKKKKKGQPQFRAKDTEERIQIHIKGLETNSTARQQGEALQWASKVCKRYRNSVEEQQLQQGQRPRPFHRVWPVPSQAIFIALRLYKKHRHSDPEQLFKDGVVQALVAQRNSSLLKEILNDWQANRNKERRRKQEKYDECKTEAPVQTTWGPFYQVDPPPASFLAGKRKEMNVKGTKEKQRRKEDDKENSPPTNFSRARSRSPAISPGLASPARSGRFPSGYQSPAARSPIRPVPSYAQEGEQGGKTPPFVYRRGIGGGLQNRLARAERLQVLQARLKKQDIRKDPDGTDNLESFFQALSSPAKS